MTDDQDNGAGWVSLPRVCITLFIIAKNRHNLNVYTYGIS